MRILMTAAHGGFGSESVPLGGGAAIFERLARAWSEASGLELILAGGGPDAGAAVQYFRLGSTDSVPSQLGALQYSRFSREFERESTRLALELRPDIVLAHDVSEGPNLAAMRAEGIECATIFHVDVVEIFRRLYLGGLGSTDRLTELFRRTEKLPWPDLLRLVFDKQEQVLRHGLLSIVPSSEAASLLSKSYPDRRGEIEVHGWGVPRLSYSDEEIAAEARRLRFRYGIPEGAVLLLTLSRLSPEKAQDRLLRALAYAEAHGRLPRELHVAIAGAPAFMKGESHARLLRRLAGRLSIPVHFPGHVGGLERAAWYRAADLFVVNSLHESYGLTTLEAQQQGCPVVAVESSGTRDTVDAEVGRLVPPGPQLEARLWGEIELLIADRDGELKSLSAAASVRAEKSGFEGTAAQVLESLRSALHERRSTGLS